MNAICTNLFYDLSEFQAQVSMALSAPRCKTLSLGLHRIARLKLSKDVVYVLSNCFTLMQVFVRHG